MDTIKVGKFLKELRVQKGLTQEEVAEKLALTSKTISRWETGNGLPDILTINLVAELYGVTVDELLAGERKKTEGLKESKDKTNLYFIIALVILLGGLGLDFICGLLFGRIVALVISVVVIAVASIVYLVFTESFRKPKRNNYFDIFYLDGLVVFYLAEGLLAYIYTSYPINYFNQRLIFLLGFGILYLLLRLKAKSISDFKNAISGKRYFKCLLLFFILYGFLAFFGLLICEAYNGEIEAIRYFPVTLGIFLYTEGSMLELTIIKISYALVLLVAVTFLYYAYKKQKLAFLVLATIFGLASNIFVFYYHSKPEFNPLSVLALFFSYLGFYFLNATDKNIRQN